MRRRPSLRGGFTLLEVMAAVAILSLVLVTLFGLQNRSVQDVSFAEHMTTATLLAKRVMAETIAGKPLLPLEEEGTFEEDVFKEYTWKKAVLPIPIPGFVVSQVQVVVLWNEGERQEMVELMSYE